MAMSYKGGVISATAPTTSAGGAPGSWTLKQQMQAIGSSLWTGIPDAYYKYVSLLLPGNGTNGAQNNTFLDSSSNNFTITRNGNTTQGTFTPYGANWSNYFSNSPYLSLSGNPAFAIATSTTPFTVEAWVFATASTTGTVFAERYTGGANTISIQCGFDSGTTWAAGLYPTFGFFNGSAWSLCRASSQISLNTWTHLAYVFTGSTCKIYINGVDTTNSSPTPPTTWGVTGVNGDAWYIGANGDISVYFSGYISNLRFVNGTAVYTGNFTPSTTPLTAITNTALLTCQSNRFRDNSSNAFAITINGTPSTQVFSPFSPTTYYAPDAVGGSGYFDGSGDYLSVANNAAFDAGSTWCAECWVYPTYTSGNDKTIFGNQQAISYPTNYPGWDFIAPTPTTIAFRWGYPNYTDTGSFSYSGYAWNHLAVSISGGRLSFYVNGTRVYTTTSNTSISASGAATYVGWSGNNSVFNGYISSARLVKGSTPYDPTASTITVPTAPLTAITNTSLLLSGTNAAIIDNAMMNDLETVGNAQTSTTQSKWGGSSMYFDGTGDWLQGRNTRLLDIGSGDFTIEGWLYPTTSGTTRAIISQFNTNGTGPGWTSYLKTTNVIEFYGGSGTITVTGTGTVSANTWSHFAICRYGSTITIYVNGIAGGTGTNSSFSDDTTGPVEIGARAGTGAIPFTGYIDDLRITKGYARYTATFTPPAGPFTPN